MGKKSYFKEDIQNMLKEQALYGYDIKNKLKMISDKPVKDKTVCETLHNLIKDGCIQVEGYNPDLNTSKRKQSFKMEGLLFGTSKQELYKIIDTIKEIEEGKTKEAEKLFSQKIRNIESQKNEKWESNKDLIHRDLNENELRWLEAHRRLSANLINEGTSFSILMDKKEYNNWVKFYSNRVTTDILELKKNYRNVMIRHRKNKEPIIPIEDPLNVYDFFKYNLEYSFKNKEERRNWQLWVQGLGGLPDEMLVAYEFRFFEHLNDEKFLEHELGYPKPTKLKEEDIRELFDKLTIYLINSDTSKSDKLIKKLAYGLSKKRNSYQCWNQVMTEIFKLDPSLNKILDNTKMFKKEY